MGSVIATSVLRRSPQKFEQEKLFQAKNDERLINSE
jgi:hypothetical protein